MCAHQDCPRITAGSRVGVRHIAKKYEIDATRLSAAPSPPLPPPASKGAAQCAAMLAVSRMVAPRLGFFPLASPQDIRLHRTAKSLCPFSASKSHPI
jgi:hypothetical protein